MQEQNINYIAKYMKETSQAESIEQYFDKSVVADPKKLPDLLKTQRRISVLNQELAELKNNELEQSLSVYSPKLTTVSKDYRFVYRNKSSGKQYQFDADGYPFMPNEEEESKILRVIELGTKHSEQLIFLGYNVEKALGVYAKYKISITQNNERANKRLLGYVLINFLNVSQKFDLDTDGNVTELFRYYDISYHDTTLTYYIRKFYKEFYNVNYVPDCSINDLQQAAEKVNFELVIKTAPAWLFNAFIHNSRKLHNREQVNHVHKLVGVSKDLYNEYKDVPNHLYMMKFLIQEAKVSKSKAKDIVDTITDMAEEFQMFGKNLRQRVSNLSDDAYIMKELPLSNVMTAPGAGIVIPEWDLFYKLVQFYYRDEGRDKGDYVRKYYTIGAFLNYARDAIINQGFNDVSSFLTQLNDYIRFNDEDGAIPVVKPDYLRRVHDVYISNRKIVVTEEMQAQFVERYAEVEDWVMPPNKKLNIKDEDIEYIITYPREAADLIKEGNLLNHCVGGYIPRVVSGSTMIYFLRRREFVDEPFVTVEVRDGKIVQARGVTNRDVSPSVKAYLHAWASVMNLRMDI